jgi:hypothetical protein
MSKITKKEWTGVFAVAGALDVIQWVIDFTGVGIAVNEVADPIIGVIALGYFEWRGVSMIKHMSRALSLLGATALEDLTGSIAPAWIIDVWYIHKSVVREEAEERAQQTEAEFMKTNIQKPLYKDGARQPRNISDNSQSQPANMNGIRAPGGGLN